MANFRELGITEGETVRFHPSYRGATWGPSYAAETHEATVIKTEGNGDAVYVHPPHQYNSPNWLVQNVVTGRIIRRARETMVNEIRGLHTAVPIDESTERFVQVLVGSDKYRFVPRTRAQFMRTFLKDALRALFRPTDRNGRVGW